MKPEGKIGFIGWEEVHKMIEVHLDTVETTAEYLVEKEE